MRELLSSVLLISNLIWCQEKVGETESFTIADDVNILNTPRFYRSYFSEYHIDGNWYFRQEMQERSHDNLINSQTIIDFPMLLKYQLTAKHSILFGPNTRVLKTNGSFDIGGVSMFSTFGYQYNVSDDISMDARADYNLMKQECTNMLIPATGTNDLGDGIIYRVGAKLKF